MSNGHLHTAHCYTLCQAALEVARSSLPAACTPGAAFTMTLQNSGGLFSFAATLQPSPPAANQAAAVGFQLFGLRDLGLMMLPALTLRGSAAVNSTSISLSAPGGGPLPLGLSDPASGAPFARQGPPPARPRGA